MKKGLFLVLALAMNLYACGQQDKSKLERKLNSYLNQLEENGFNGSVLIASQGTPLVVRGLGYADTEAGIKNTATTVFDIGSITKQFTGAAILKLEMQGKLSVDDAISKYLKIPTHRNDISIHHLLTHSSGLPAAIGDDYEWISEDNFIRQAMTTKRLFEPGEAYEYSNVGYTLLAMIIEKVSGVSYEAYLFKNLWKPAGMYKTGYQVPDYSSGEIAVGYRNNNRWGTPVEKWDRRGPTWHLKGNGGILSTVEDMYKWHQALLENDILSDKAKAKYYKKHIKEYEDGNSYYGYGWAVFPTSRNTELIAHNGGNGIFFADFWRYLTENITLIIMTNSAKRSYHNLCGELSRIIREPDYLPRMIPTREDSEVFTETAATSLADSFIAAIVKNDASEWQNFILNQTTQEFQNITSMDGHMKMFSQIHKELSDKKVSGITVSGDEITIVFQEDIVVTMGMEETKNGIKISGIIL